MNRRKLFFGLLALIPGLAAAQRAILEGKKAVVCKEDAVICPVCKKQTCKSINAPIVVGNDNRYYPDQSQLFDYHILRCENCHAAFFAE